MASLINQSAQLSDGHPDGYRVMAVPRALYPSALLRMVGPKSSREELAATLGPQTELFAAVYPGNEVGQVVMVIPGSGQTAAFYISGPGKWTLDAGAEFGSRLRQGTPEEEHRERVAVLNYACTVIGADGGCVLGQGLIEPSELELRSAYCGAGFEHLADLAYLRRDIPRFGRIERPNFPAGVMVTRVSDLDWNNAKRELKQAMERSYIDTLDCPALCGMRSVEDVLDSHLAVGEFDPTLWWLVYTDGRPEGCVLLSRFPQHGTVELVYVGIGPLLRGRGLGTALMQMATAELQALGERCLACAVDLKNTPALGLYTRMKFRRFTERVALIRDFRAGRGV